MTLRAIASLLLAALTFASVEFVGSAGPIAERSATVGPAVRATAEVGGQSTPGVNPVSSGRTPLLARTTTRSRGTSGQHVPDVAERALPTLTPGAQGAMSYVAIPSSAPRAILVPRGSPLTVVRDENDVELAIIEASREFGVNGAELLCVARAESGFRTDLLGHAGERGPMQFMPRTWGYFERLPDHTARWTGNSAALGYSEQDVWRAIPAARVAASLWAKGQQGAWSTYAGCAR